MFAKLEGPRSVWDKSLLAVEFSQWCFAIAEVELKKLFRDPMELFSRAVQPVLWLVVFGQVFTASEVCPSST